MLDSQRLQIRISEIRSRLNEISGLEGDKYTAEIRQESDKLTQEFREVESKYRTAAILEDEETQKGAPVDSETAEIRSLTERAELRNYLSVAASGGNLTGPESELNAALEIRGAGTQVPWSVIAPPMPVETRADAATALPAAGVQVIERDFVGRVFAGGAADFLGVRMDSVPVGESNFFVLTAGASAVHQAPGAVQDAAAATIVGKTLEPHRLTAAYTFRIEDLARSNLLENALREDLSNALREQMDNAVLNGAASGHDPTGFFAGLGTAPADPTAEIAFGTAVGLVAGAVEGKYCRNLREVRALLGPESYRKVAGLFTGNGDVSASDYLLSRSGGLMASSLVPVAANGIQGGLLTRTATMGNAVSAVWPSLSLIRDEYTRATRGEIRLQAVMLWDFMILRTGGFSYVKLLLA